jgi:NAD(P)-dependent dehydrogenase (short-subunit alcohol dehydrogenase family)
MSIKPRTVLITGCSAGGIGHALAKEFHSRGGFVVNVLWVVINLVTCLGILQPRSTCIRYRTNAGSYGRAEEMQYQYF